MGLYTFSQSHERQEYNRQSLRDAINSTSVVKLCSLVCFIMLLSISSLNLTNYSQRYTSFTIDFYIIRRNSVREVNKCDEAVLDSCTVGIVHRWHSIGI